MLDRFYDQGGAGGGASPESTNPPSGAEAGEKTKEEPKPTPEQQLEALTKERDEWKGKHEALAQKAGKQGATLGQMKDMVQAMTSDPHGFLRTFAEKNKIKVKFASDDVPDLGKTFSGDDDAAKAEAVQKFGEMYQKDTIQTVQKMIDPIVEAQLASKFDDWDNLSDKRDEVGMAVHTGQMPPRLVYHYAARGMNIGEALKEAKKQAVEEYKADLARKNQEQPGTGEGRPGSGGKVATIEEALEAGMFAGLSAPSGR